jgi:hypothetical protein
MIHFSDLSDFRDLSTLGKRLLMRVLNGDSLPKGLFSDCGIDGGGDSVEYRLSCADYILQGFGIEPIYPSFPNGDSDRDTLLGRYVNLSETYALTVIYDDENEDFILWDLGSFLEERQAEYDKERDSDYISTLEREADTDIFATEESWTAWFNGRQAVRHLPTEMIVDCSRPGANDDAVEYWAERIGLDAPPWILRRYLRSEVSAWDSYGDHRQNVNRLACLWCHDAKERGDYAMEYYLGV